VIRDFSRFDLSLSAIVMRQSIVPFVALVLACGGGGGDSSSTNGPSGSISLATNPQSVTVAAGGTTMIAATATRYGSFNGAVAFTVSGLPSSVTVQSNTQVTAGVATTATITLGAAGSATATSATLTVSAAGDGVTTATAAVGLTITPPAGVQASLDFSQCAANLKPLWVAYQDGESGPWSRVQGTGDIYTFTLTQAKGGYAYVMPQHINAASRVTTIFLGARSEIANGGPAIAICTAAASGTKTITGSVAGVGAGEAVGVYLGGRFGVATATTPSFTIGAVPDGTYDLVVTRSAALPSASDRGIMRQDQNLASGTNIGVLDMSGAESFAVATGNITVNGHPSGGLLATSFVLISGPSCTASAITGYSPTASPFLMIGFPDSKIRATDMHMLTVISTSTVVGSRFVTEVFHSMGARTIDLPPELVVTATPVSGAYKRLNAAFNLAAMFNSATLGYSLISGGATRQILVTATSGWIGTGSVALPTPSFTGVSGWDDVWGPPPNATVNWTLTATGSDLQPGASLCTPGVRSRAASRSGSS
jgi:hypothetical protein